jgi:hypothetical protein
MNVDIRLPSVHSVLIASCLAVALAASGLTAFAAPRAGAKAGSAVTLSRADFEGGSTGGIEPNVLEMALGATTCAVRSGTIELPRTLTVIDYSKPSTQKRLWVFDLENRQLIYQELVAHGQGSGDDRPSLFSNEPETHRSSLGLFLTEATYVGRNGYSLRMDGLDKGVNDRARERAIVMHGAPYVSEAFIHAHGRLGRSWGCPAIRPETARELIDRIKGGGLVFAYYPDADWIKSSKFLGGCGE